MPVGGELGVAGVGARRDPACPFDAGKRIETCVAHRLARQERPVELAMLGEMLFMIAVLAQRRGARPILALRREVEHEAGRDEAIEHRPARRARRRQQRRRRRIAVIDRPDPQRIDLLPQRGEQRLERLARDTSTGWEAAERPIAARHRRKPRRGGTETRHRQGDDRLAIRLDHDCSRLPAIGGDCGGKPLEAEEAVAVRARLGDQIDQARQAIQRQGARRRRQLPELGEQHRRVHRQPVSARCVTIRFVLDRRRGQPAQPPACP